MTRRPRCGETADHPHVVAPRDLKDAKAALRMGAADAKVPCRHCGRLVSLSHARELA